MDSFTHNGSTYLVSDLLKLSKNYDSCVVLVRDLVWIFRYSTPEWRDFDYSLCKDPVICTDWCGKLVVIDGLHRLEHSFKGNKKYIDVIIVPSSEILNLPRCEK